MGVGTGDGKIRLLGSTTGATMRDLCVDILHYPGTNAIPWTPARFWTCDVEDQRFAMPSTNATLAWTGHEELCLAVAGDLESVHVVTCKSGDGKQRFSLFAD